MLTLNTAAGLGCLDAATTTLLSLFIFEHTHNHTHTGNGFRRAEIECVWKREQHFGLSFVFRQSAAKKTKTKQTETVKFWWFD